MVQKKILQESIYKYYDADYNSVVSSFEKYIERVVHRFCKLALLADQSLCRFRAEKRNLNFLKHILYRDAIIQNENYLSNLKNEYQFQTNHSRDFNEKIIEMALLATISAIWMHLRMKNTKMAFHKSSDFLYWTTSILSPGIFIQSRREALDILMHFFSDKVRIARKMLHVFNVLDLLQEMSLRLLLVRGLKFKKNTNVTEQQESVLLLTKHKLGIELSKPFNSRPFGLILKIQTLLRASTRLREENGEENEIKLLEIVDILNPSDLNLLGCFQCFYDVEKALNSFQLAFSIIEFDDHHLTREIVSNMAICYLNLGQYEKAKKILLQISYNQSIVYQPKGSHSYVLFNPSYLSKNELLWRAFVSCTMTDDFISALKVTGTLMKRERNAATLLALMFSLLQVERRTLFERCYHLANSVIMKNIPLWALHRDFYSISNQNPLQSDGLIAKVRYNNNGILFIGQGNLKKSRALFEESVNLCEDEKASIGKLYLHSHYNLTLLFWHLGKYSEALRVWSSVRFPSILKEIHADIQKKFKISRMRYKRVQEFGTRQRLIIGKMLGGMNPRFLFLLDCIVLQYQLQVVENRALVLAVKGVQKERDVQKQPR